jgi:hypothetical protein
LRNYWRQFDQLAEETQADPTTGEQELVQLVADHWRLLQAIWMAAYFPMTYVLAAWQVQIVFSTAAYFLWCSNAPDVCSPSSQIASILAYGEWFVLAVDELDNLAQEGKCTNYDYALEVRNETLTLAEQVIARMMESPRVPWALCEELLASSETQFDSFETSQELGYEIPLGSADAARFIVDMMICGEP